MGKRYPPEVLAYLTENFPIMTNRELTESVYRLFGYRMSLSAANSFGINHHLNKVDRYAYQRSHRKYSDEMLDWAREYIPGHEEHEIIEAFDERFGMRLTASMVAKLKTKLGVMSGTHGGQFKKGLIPANKGKTWDEMGYSEELKERMRRTQFKCGECRGRAKERYRPLLTVRETRDGYLQIKIDARNAKNSMGKWISLSQFEWMKANGRDWPEGHRCLFADGNNRNFDPDNLVAVPNDLYPLVQGPHGLPYHDRESLEVAITYARVLRAKVAAVNRGRKKRGKK